jgi:stage II sporulation protein AA (anti-sigma F factor antagonist)
VSSADVKVEQAGDSVGVIVVGDVDMANVDDVADAIHTAITNQVTTATVDLSDVRYIDSAGLRVLFDLAVRLPRLQIGFEVVAPPGSAARRVIDMSGFAEVARVVP